MRQNPEDLVVRFLENTLNQLRRTTDLHEIIALKNTIISGLSNLRKKLAELRKKAGDPEARYKLDWLRDFTRTFYSLLGSFINSIEKGDYEAAGEELGSYEKEISELFEDRRTRYMASRDRENLRELSSTIVERLRGLLLKPQPGTPYAILYDLDFELCLDEDDLEELRKLIIEL